MKKYQLHTKTEDILKRFPALCKRLEGAERTPEHPGSPRVLCLGADLEKAGACLALQCGLGEPLSLGTLSRETVLSLLAALRARGWRCVFGMEACGFGWRFQRELRAAGAEALTFATEALSGRRKTNARDAAALARLVADRTVHGNTTTSRVVREPSPQEQQRRHLSRHRAQLIALRGKIEAQGRGLMYDFGRLDFPECWWGKKMWPRLVAQLTAAGEDWLREALEPQRAMAQAVHAQILELDARLAALAAQTLTLPLPHGLGQLTALTACLEVMDWQRFHNRKQVGSYIGCAPSEHSTGGDGQLLGAIDRQGNRRLRSLLTEAIWRLIRWEPRWHGFTKWGAILRDTHGSSVRKKLARSPASTCPGRRRLGHHRLRAPALHRPLAPLHRTRHPRRSRLQRPARQHRTHRGGLPRLTQPHHHELTHQRTNAPCLQLTRDARNLANGKAPDRSPAAGGRSRPSTV